MKGLVKKENKPGLWLEDVPRPAVGINDVLIRVDRTGICGTDLHSYNHGGKIAKLAIPSEPMAIDWNAVLNLRASAAHQGPACITFPLQRGVDESGC